MFNIRSTTKNNQTTKTKPKQDNTTPPQTPKHQINKTKKSNYDYNKILQTTQTENLERIINLSFTRYVYGRKHVGS